MYLFNKDIFGIKQFYGYGNLNDLFIKEIEPSIAINFVKKNHYSKCVVQNSYIHIGVYLKNELYGVLQFGYAMNPNSFKSIHDDLNSSKELVELNRMVVLDSLDNHKYYRSMIISYCIKFIKIKYKQCKIIQSFADARCKKDGVVYRASNFGYYGSHLTDFYKVDNRYFHKILYNQAKRIIQGKEKSKGEVIKIVNNFNNIKIEYFKQHRFLYFIDKKLEKGCKHKKIDFNVDKVLKTKNNKSYPQ